MEKNGKPSRYDSRPDYTQREEREEKEKWDP